MQLRRSASTHVTRRPRFGGAVVVHRLAPCSSSSRTGSSAAPTCRSRRRCSAPPRRPCWSSRSSRSRRLVAAAARARARARRCSASRASSRSLLGALGVVVFVVDRLRGPRRHRRRRATTSRRPRSTSPSGSACRSLSLLFGDVLRLLSARGARSAAATGWVARRVVGRRDARAAALPGARSGRWPAAAGLFGFAICELCWATATEPGPLAIMMLVYFVVDARRDEPLRRRGVDAQRRRVRRLVRRCSRSLAPIGRRADGRLVLRAARASARRALAPVAGTAALLIVCDRHRPAFDGAKEGAAVQRPRAATCRTSSRASGSRIGFGLELAFVVGLLVAIGLIVARSGRSAWTACRGRSAASIAAGARARVRAHADPDRRRLPRRPLLLAARLQRPGPVAARLRPARQRLATLRRRAERDRLRRRLGHRHLVRPGRRARRRPRRRARARPRPRAGDLRRRPRRRPARRSSCWC